MQPNHLRAEAATGLPIPIGAAADRRDGEVDVTINALVPGAAQVTKLR